MRTIAGPVSGVRRRRSAKPQQRAPATKSLLDTFEVTLRPAFVLGRRLDVLGQNRLAALLIADFGNMPAAERNQARFVFLDPHARELYVEGDQAAADTAAMLRRDAGRDPYDPALAQLVGDITITYQALTPGDDADQTVMVYDTEPGSSSVHALQLLAAKIPEHAQRDTTRQTHVAPGDIAQPLDR